MLHLEPSAFTVIAVFMAAHVLNTLGSWLIHYLQHQKLFGIAFHRIHFHAHHDVKLKRSDPRAYRRWAVIGHVQWLIMIALVLYPYFVLFSPWVATLVVVEGLLMGILMYYY